MAGTVRIGISGWRYEPWRGVFYPEDLRQKDELHYASRRLRTIEINGSFYTLQRPSSYKTWHDTAPEDFVFSVKAPRFITHIRRLKDVEAPLANFFASGVLRLGKKLGPILWQFPPNFVFNAERVESFLRMLPRTSAKAAEFAKEHDAFMKKDRVWTTAEARIPIRHAMEVRHESFANPEFIGLLRKHEVALAVADSAGKFPFMEDVTADFMYLRLHGKGKLYVGGYGEKSLDEWERKLRAWMRGSQPKDAELAGPKLRASATPKERDIFVYFDNDAKVKAPRDAMELAKRFGFSPNPENA